MKRFAPVRTEEYITGKQHIVLSAHLNCSLGLGIFAQSYWSFLHSLMSQKCAEWQRIFALYAEF